MKEIGILLWCIGFVFFLFLLLFSKMEKLKQSFDHIGFRIIADIAVESELWQKTIKKVVAEALREELSKIKIRELDEKDNNK